MTRFRLLSLAPILLLSTLSMAQATSPEPAGQTARQTSWTLARTVTIVGTISEDGKTLLSSKTGERWAIANADAVEGFEGQPVKAKCRVERERDEVQVLRVTVESEATSSARLGDAAFRR